MHSDDSKLVPEQVSPPNAGAGLLHVLALDLDPPPHSSLQADQDCQELHSPSIALEKRVHKVKIVYHFLSTKAYRWIV